MNCAEAEVLICDYATLTSAERFELERHLGVCPACAELAHDAAEGYAVLHAAPEIEPPLELVNRILFQAPWTNRKSRLRQWLDPLLSPILQPRYAMSMAMTIVSFAMLARFVVPMKTIRAEDLRPAAVWSGLEDRAFRLWGRALKFYDNLKVVYDIQTTLKDWQQKTEEQQPAAAPPAHETIDDHRLPVHPLPRNSNEPGGAPLNHAPDKQN
jgi:hypothetical protein